MKDIAMLDVLGTMYVIYESKMSTDDSLKENGLAGYCDATDRKIVIADITEKEYFDLDSDEARKRYRQELLRHEIIHAFLSEAGLRDSANPFESAWTKNEEMIDWFAIMWTKIQTAFEAVGAYG